MDNKSPEQTKPKFTESYKKLCMTDEVRKEFNVPLKGNWVIHEDDPDELLSVYDGGGEYTYVDDQINWKIETRKLIWLPTIEEIKENFLIQPNNGSEHGFQNFLRDPKKYGYDRKNFSLFTSDEEKWILYCICVKRGRIFRNGIWVQFKYQ